MISSCFSSFTLHRFQYSRLKNRHTSGEHFLYGTTNQATPWLTRSTLFRMPVRYKPPFSLQVSSTLKSISEHRTVLGHGLPQLFCWDNGLFRHYEDALPGLAIQSRNERKQRGRRQRRISPCCCLSSMLDQCICLRISVVEDMRKSYSPLRIEMI